MKTKEVLLQLIPQRGILPLYFHKEQNVSVEVMKALYRAGIRAIEYTNRGKEAFENFVKMREISNVLDSKMYLGIGIVKDPETARKYMMPAVILLFLRTFKNNRHGSQHKRNILDTRLHESVRNYALGVSRCDNYKKFSREIFLALQLSVQ